NSDWEQRQDYSIRLISADQDILGLGVIIHENIVERVSHWEYLPISAILQEFGQPETVYYFSTGVSDGGNPLFSLVLTYPTQGILIKIMDSEHGQYILRDDGGHIQICAPVIGLSGEEITFYDPDDTQLQATILEDVTSISSHLNDLSMELDMSMEEFYQTFSDPVSQACLTDPEPFPPEWVGW
ncbi:MAG TPA: hypothetical protein VN376_06520, partial [Longilinea sp.]|nr:hypothetical protein [Longilinea sp.]